MVQAGGLSKAQRAVRRAKGRASRARRQANKESKLQHMWASVDEYSIATAETRASTHAATLERCRRPVPSFVLRELRPGEERTVQRRALQPLQQQAAEGLPSSRGLSRKRRLAAMNEHAAACCGSTAADAARLGLVDSELRRVARKIFGPDRMKPD